MCQNIKENIVLNRENNILWKMLDFLGINKRSKVVLHFCPGTENGKYVCTYPVFAPLSSKPASLVKREQQKSFDTIIEFIELESFW